MTEKYARFRIKDPGRFKPSSLRTQSLGERVKRVAGQLKSTGDWDTQALLIDRVAFEKRPEHYAEMVERFM
jgi:hypothetical protein